jgi:transcriptional regulator
MYTPRPFQIGSDEARELLSTISAAQLITATSQGPMATLIPWVVDLEGNRLLGHISRINSQWSTPWLGEAMVLADSAIGPNAYVRPNWYATKQETGSVVPTWNYVALQVSGELIVHDDADWTLEAVRQLTERHEAHRSDGWKVSDSPDSYIQAQLKAIVGLELKISNIEASVKMSQNKNEADSAGVIAGFAAEGNQVMSEYVRKVSKHQL